MTPLAPPSSPEVATRSSSNLRIHTPQTAVTHYVSEFMLVARNKSGRDAFQTATKLLLAWANEKRRHLDFAIREERFGGDADAPDAWAMHLQHREYVPKNEYRRHWHIDVALQRQSTGYEVRISVAHALDHAFVGWAPPAPEPSAPKFVYDWLAHENLELRSGQFPIALLSAKPDKIPTLKNRVTAFNVRPQDAPTLARLIFDSSRALPVMVIHGDINPVTFPILPARLQQLLLGTCYVVSAPPTTGWVSAWAEHLPKNFDCRMNTVRLYQPGASALAPGDHLRHRYFGEREILEHGGSAAFIAMIRDGLTRRLLVHKPGRLASCEDVLALRVAADFATQRSTLMSTGEELALYVSEHERLLAKEKLSDQLLHEAGEELENTKAELAALRPHANELAIQLEAAKAVLGSAPPFVEHSDLLRKFVAGEVKVHDYLLAISTLYPDAIVLLPSAVRSAEEADKFEHAADLSNMLLKLVTDYRDSLIAGKNSQEAVRLFGRNNFSTKESDILTRKGEERRTFSYKGESIFMENHLKIGVKDSEARTLRVHFHWDAEAKKIVIGWCGKHLPL